MDEIILVDINDREIGSCEKLAAHTTMKLDRAFSVFIVNDGKMLIQKRNKEKYHSGGLWANACCSHPRKGEQLDTAVTRRLSEELGIQANVTEVFHFIYSAKFSETLYEYELDHVFIGSYSGDVTPDPEEIEECQWVPFDVLAQKLVETPEIFSAWFIIAAPACFTC